MGEKKRFLSGLFKKPDGCCNMEIVDENGCCGADVTAGPQASGCGCGCGCSASEGSGESDTACDCSADDGEPSVKVLGSGCT